jgi:hypothetical protein
MGKAMKTIFPVGWSSDSDRLMEEAVPGAVAIDRPVESCTGLMAAPVEEGPAELALALELPSLDMRCGRRMVTFHVISPSSSFVVH